MDGDGFGGGGGGGAVSLRRRAGRDASGRIAAGRAGAARPSGVVRRRDRGSLSIELIGFLPVLLLVGLAAIQLGLAAYAAQQAGSAARAAARTASLDDPRMSPAAAGRAAMSGWLRTAGAPAAAPCAAGAPQTTAEVTVVIPTVLPLLGERSVTRRATMPCPADPGTGLYPPLRSTP
ncbi:septum formation initiator [Streptomyces klenkii]|uniref:Septum formation initiator n=1 Tax=Streptomyces klenkii TaxID=1420899 RepID=A0A3B0BVZ6_9ACTN|nr:septum formation initiator [Streptomyces klenkii]